MVQKRKGKLELDKGESTMVYIFISGHRIIHAYKIPSEISRTNLATSMIVSRVGSIRWRRNSFHWYHICKKNNTEKLFVMFQVCDCLLQRLTQ